MMGLPSKACAKKDIARVKASSFCASEYLVKQLLIAEIGISAYFRHLLPNKELYILLLGVAGVIAEYVLENHSYHILAGTAESQLLFHSTVGNLQTP
jgi:hypothetical protein